MKFIYFKLNAPLQSWGERAKWNYRGTEMKPTKSGIVGLISCCLGIGRNDSKLVSLSESIHMAVRTLKTGLVMTDFHTVMASSGKNFLLANGDIDKKGDPILTYRQYIQDAMFDVFLWGDEDALDDCYMAMLHPVWTPYLGRKSCVPSVPLLPCIIEAESIDDAVRMYYVGNEESLSVEIEMLPGDILRDDERVSLRRDNAINASRNDYDIRKVRSSYIRMKEE